MLIELIIWLFLNPGNEALPISERDAPSPPSALSTYTPTRSLYNIISSCAVTTFLCAWVSIHLNTLPNQGGPLEKVGLRVRFLLLTIFAPELVIGWASMERTAARRIKDGFRREGIKISMTHAHLIKMGSFALCFPEEKLRQLSTIKDEESSIPIIEEVPELKAIGDNLRRVVLNEETAEKDENNVQEIAGNNIKATEVAPTHSDANDQIQEVPRNTEETPMKDRNLLIVDDDSLIKLRYIETLSARHFLRLLSQSKPSIRFPIIAPCELQDRSKTDALARFITAVQVLWFVVQCIVRHVQGLAITQLELTTLALACLNAYMLWLWRDKPQGVDAQIPVYLLEDSEEWETRETEWEQRQAETTQRKEEEMQRDEGANDLPIWSKCRRSLSKLWQLILGFWNGFWDGFLGRGRQESQTEDDEDLDQGLLPDNFLRGFDMGYHATFGENLPSWLSFIIIAAFFLLLTPVVLSVLIGGGGLWLAESLLAILLSPIVLLLLKVPRLHKFLDDHLLNRRRRLLWIWTAVDYASQAGYVGTVFGGLHCAGWNFSFPTTVEQALWRAMSLILAITPLFSVISAINFESMSKNRLLTMSTSFALMFAMAFLAYAFARLCILALALELLRSQPASAYLAVRWTKLFPHASS